jgi:SpoVK/Ycf46/Vps4 family AAA+-type ATPase
MWRLPLLRLDFGTLYNKFFGETERNPREAFRAAEAMAPCVLWIDEIEKAIVVSLYLAREQQMPLKHGAYPQ